MLPGFSLTPAVAVDARGYRGGPEAAWTAVGDRARKAADLTRGDRSGAADHRGVVADRLVAVVMSPSSGERASAETAAAPASCAGTLADRRATVRERPRVDGRTPMSADISPERSRRTSAAGIAWILRTGRDRPFQERRRLKQEAKVQAKQEAGKPTESLPLRLLGKGDPKVTFVVGALLSFPGVSYLDALDHIHKLNPGTIPTVLLVIYFCLMQQILIELPMLGYLFGPDRTQQAVTGSRTRSHAAAALLR
jgi:hypothetical protein